MSVGEIVIRILLGTVGLGTSILIILVVIIPLMRRIGGWVKPDEDEVIQFAFGFLISLYVAVLFAAGWLIGDYLATLLLL